LQSINNQYFKKILYAVVDGIDDKIMGFVTFLDYPILDFTEEN
jgi:hypothetical protein